jgi:hypothetical protein
MNSIDYAKQLTADAIPTRKGSTFYTAGTGTTNDSQKTHRETVLQERKKQGATTGTKGEEVSWHDAN